MFRKLLPLALFVLACQRSEGPAKPAVILISIDTLRSDHLPAYGYASIATPHIDSLAADGIVFERAFSHVPLTLPSHVSIFTGLVPAHHRVRDNAGSVLDAKTPTIASILKAHGYATGGVVSAYVLRASTNAGAGFESYDDRIAYVEGAPTGNLARPGGDAVALAQSWIAEHASQPFFAFVHLFEPHAPYEPTYDADIVKADQLVGELLAWLREKGLYDDALIVLLSDHGEGLMDHGEKEHGVLLYREALQVPLIVKLPRNVRRGTRVSEVVQLVDVLPMIAAVTHAAAPSVDGRSLLGPATARPAYAETLYPRIHLGWSELRSVIEWPYHFIDGPKPELYDLSRDSHETNNLRETDRRTFARLRNVMAAAPQASAISASIDPEEAQKLAALGYLSAQRPVAQSNLNPRDHLGDLATLERVTKLMGMQRFAEAAAEIERVLAHNPGWSDLRDDLGVAYEALGDLPRAEKAYRDAIRYTPELAGEFALSLANVLLDQRKFDDAEAHARLALETNPQGAHEMLANIALFRGDLTTAAREAEVAQADLVTAQVQMAQNDIRGALETLQRMFDTWRAEKRPLPRAYWIIAGDALARAGRPREARDAYERLLRVDPTDRIARERLMKLAR